MNNVTFLTLVALAMSFVPTRAAAAVTFESPTYTSVLVPGASTPVSHAPIGLNDRGAVLFWMLDAENLSQGKRQSYPILQLLPEPNRGLSAGTHLVVSFGTSRTQSSNFNDGAGGSIMPRSLNKVRFSPLRRF